MRPILSIFLLIAALTAQAQQKHTISGTVRDKNSGEVLIGATVTLAEIPKSGSISNSYGFYSLSAPEGSYTLIASFSGYKPDTVTVTLNKDIIRSMELAVDNSELEAVVVSSKKKDANVTNPVAGVQKLSVNEIKSIPVLFGERDVLKTIQLLPGIKSAGEGNSGFYVRGGSADQNLILLDEATVYNASHLLGFFSAFNSDAIKDLTVYKGAMPAEYGGRLSSVVDIKMNDGNDQSYHVSGGIGLIASRVNIEGPIVKNRGSFIISARRTYADVFLKLSPDSSVNNNSLYFYDLNAKANYKIDDKNHVYLSGYFGHDNFGLGETFGIGYGNSTATARWNHIFNSRLFSNTSFIYSNYNYDIKINSGTNDLLIKSKIQDLALKEDLQYYINNNNRINFGFNAIYHTFAPGVVAASATSSFNSISVPNKYALENAVYISHQYTPFDALKLEYGLRFSAFSVLGPGNFYTYDNSGNAIDTATYKSGQFVKTYLYAEPRFSASYQVNTVSSFKVSYTRNVQNMHLLSNSASSSPTDIWIPSSINVKPEIADQVSLGYYRNFKDNQYEFSAETYYKSLQHQIDYKDGAQLNVNENVESELLYGIGRAYGLELYTAKKYGRLTGWISYTLSRTERKINGINNDNWYAAKQDETHNIAVVGIYKLNKKWTFSANWVYNTGNAVTFPSGKYEVNGQTTFYYTERNGYRMPAYHRLDLGATMVGKKTAKWESDWTFSIYNAYGRENAYSIRFQNDPNDPSKTQAVQTALFRWVPSVTYDFKF